MSFILQPWQLLLMILASWVHRDQQKVIEFYQSPLDAMMKAQGKKRLPLTDDQRRLLAVQGKSLGRKALMELTTIVTPDTLLRWHRRLVAAKWDHNTKRNMIGRPRIRQVVVDLILRFARENPSWGYDRIQGALANVGYHISDTTVGNLLKQHGIEPAPDRKRQTTWKTFIKSHWDVLAAIDFTTVEVWTKGGLVTYYLLFVMELATRRVDLAACTPSLGDMFMKQIARNLTDPMDGFLKDKRYVLMDRDANFSDAFRTILEPSDVKPVRLPARSPDLNSHLERFHLSLKSECLDKMIFFGERSLRHACNEFLAHYHGERNHQGLGNKLIEPAQEVGEGYRRRSMSRTAWWPSEIRLPAGGQRDVAFANSTISAIAVLQAKTPTGLVLRSNPSTVPVRPLFAPTGFRASRSRKVRPRASRTGHKYSRCNASYPIATSTSLASRYTSSARIHAATVPSVPRITRMHGLPPITL